MPYEFPLRVCQHSKETCTAIRQDLGTLGNRMTEMETSTDTRFTSLEERIAVVEKAPKAGRASSAPPTRGSNVHGVDYIGQHAQEPQKLKSMYRTFARNMMKSISRWFLPVEHTLGKLMCALIVLRIGECSSTMFASLPPKHSTGNALL